MRCPVAKMGAGSGRARDDCAHGPPWPPHSQAHRHLLALVWSGVAGGTLAVVYVAKTHFSVLIFRRRA